MKSRFTAKTQAIIKTMRVSLFLTCIVALACCSCISTGVQPQDPFAGPDFAVEESSRSEVPRQMDVPVFQPEYKPVPKTDGEHTRLVSTEPVPYVIQQVAFTQDETNAAPIVVPVEPSKARLTDLTVDPALAEQGAQIIEQHHEGREMFQGSWRPAVVAGFWPQGEYLADGGDDGQNVYIEDDWTVRNLGIEDTVAHFDTLDGRVIVEPSNRVHIYAPRFGAVRKVEGVLNSGQITTLSEANNQLVLNVDEAKEQLGFTAQETQTGYARTQNRLGGVGSRSMSTGAANAQNLSGFGAFESVMLYSNWLRQNHVGAAELAYLAEGSAGARAWEGLEGVKVQMNAQAAMSATSEEGAESFFQIEEDKSKSSKLRLIKVASKKTAQPGEIVDFTLRFDNVGNQPIGNVTVLDSLTTRLEFLPGSAKASLKSEFFVEPNDAGSFILRFEITDPLSPGQFGVVQFQCRVR